jgi:hypothetical protein
MEQQLAPAKISPVINSQDQWETLQRQCKAFIQSGFLPEHITRNCTETQAMAKAITIAIKGRELGLPTLQSFNSITVIKGKPCLSAELMLALVYSRVAGAKVTFLTAPEKAHEECEVEMQRANGNPQKFKFSMDDAKRAGLLSAGSAWSKYPQAMLRARVISAGCRAVFPDAIMGCYTPEELGGPILEGEIVDEPNRAATLNAALKTKPEFDPSKCEIKNVEHMTEAEKAKFFET